MIFINYRRDDSGPYAARLHDLLGAFLDREDFFFDIDTISPGRDFREAIEESIASCKVMLVVIGKHWATLTDRSGRPRLESEVDFVRLEIISGLKRGLVVIPVLVADADMPEHDALPAELRPLVFRNNWVLSDRGFRQDVQRLAEQIKKILPTAPSLFPLFGITPGKTTEADLPAAVRKEGRLYMTNDLVYDAYLHNDVKFGFKDGICKAVSVAKGIPSAWEKLGFRSQNSYDEWLSVLKASGYSITVALKPSFNRIDKVDIFQAIIFAEKQDPFLHVMKLHFHSNSGTSRTAPGTLSYFALIAIDRPDIEKAIAFENERVKRAYHYGYGVLGLGSELI
jgi:hypothetical protein